MSDLKIQGEVSLSTEGAERALDRVADRSSSMADKMRQSGQRAAQAVDDISSALKETRPVFFNGDGWLDTPIYDRSKLGFGAKAQGPLVVEEPTTATVVCPGQSLSVDEYGNLIVEMEGE